MPIGARRDKVLHGLVRKRGRSHRYTRVRIAVAVGFTLAVAALPATGLLRFDLWGGRHFAGGREMDFVTAAKAFAFPFLGVNVAILLATRFLGRYLCGFVCPIGAIARIAEWLRTGRRTRARRLAGQAALAASCAVLAAICFSFWIDWRVFAAGSAGARIVCAAVLAGTFASLFAGARSLGLGFCRDWCPSGVYFALLGQETASGVELAHPESCTECGLCDAVCPIDLFPKGLTAEVGRGGEHLYPHWVSDHALCIRCGDCVLACEGTTGRLGVPTPLRLGTLRGGSGRARDEDETRSPEPATPIGAADERRAPQAQATMAEERSAAERSAAGERSAAAEQTCASDRTGASVAERRHGRVA